MKIEILLLCHNYQHRLNWDLSSLLVQELPSDLELAVSICTLPKNGEPSTEEVVKFFNGQGLRVKHLVMEDRERFAHRGYTRNDQVTALDSDTTHVLFSDCDMVYEPTFFAELKPHIEAHQGEKGVMCVGRYSNDPRYIDELMKKHNYPSVAIDFDLLKLISTIPKANVAAGYFQMVSVERLGGYYIEEGTSRDRHMFKKGLNPKSDVQFKKRFNKQKIKINLEARQFHLNHNRDPEAGKHLEEQR